MNEVRACASGFILSAVRRNGLPQNQKLFVYFLAAKSNEFCRDVSLSCYSRYDFFALSHSATVEEEIEVEAELHLSLKNRLIKTDFFKSKNNIKFKIRLFLQ